MGELVKAIKAITE